MGAHDSFDAVGAISRRRMLHAAARLGSGATVLAALSGCSRAPGASPPLAQLPRVQEIPFQVHAQGPWTPTLQGLVQDYVDKHFNAKLKSVRMVAEAQHNMPGVISSTLAGKGPLVIAGYGYDFPTVLSLLQPLDTLLHDNNVNTNVWSQGQLSTFRLPGGLYAVPAYTGAEVYCYRQDILDSLGLAYPDPAWTYRDAERLWASCVSTQGKQHRYGASLAIGSTDIQEGYYLLHGFGGAFISQDRTRCLLDSAASIRAGEWAMGLVWEGVVSDWGHGPGGLNRDIATGGIVFTAGEGAAVLWAAQNLGGVKWDFIPYPTWPVAPAVPVNIDFYAINRQAGNAELAWELFQFLTLDPGWTRFVMSLTLQMPALLSQWDEWMALVASVAPSLRDKALHYWKDAALSGIGYGAQFFHYAPAQAIGVLDSVWPQIWRQKVSVANGFHVIAQKINTLQETAVTEPARASAAVRSFPRKGPAMAAVPADL